MRRQVAHNLSGCCMFDLRFDPQIRSQIASNIYAIITIQWRPVYPTVPEFVSACSRHSDPFHIRYVPSGESLSPFRTHEEIREARYIDRISRIVGQLPAWKEERLPPPRVSQSQYDKVGLTRMWNLPYSALQVLIPRCSSSPVGLGLRPWTTSTLDFPLHHCPPVSLYRGTAFYPLSL